MAKQTTKAWEFVDDDGTFMLRDPEQTSDLYFPLANDAGMMSSVTPDLRGDAKTGQNAFLLTPCSAYDLHHNSGGRNFWIHADGAGVWSAVGHSAAQHAARQDGDETTLRAGLLWQEVTRTNRTLGLEAKVTSFVPADSARVELLRVELRNIAEQPVRVTPTAAIPIYARSADNIRSHRHVTSLLHRVYTLDCGVCVDPTMVFDERGHRPNDMQYGVYGLDNDGEPPIGFFPLLADFVGEGGGLDWPAAVVENREATTRAGERFDGFESLGGLRFETIELAPGQTASYRIAMTISPRGEEIDIHRLLDAEAFEESLQRTRATWRERTERLRVSTGNRDFDRWMRWVGIQPVLRRIYGCSFLPHHDYGRGGRGWRDLWQDCLALVLTGDANVRELLLANYGGVRIDGSNATIIGQKPGTFLADRERIPRVWMDHGAWPWLTTKLYIDQTGDLAFLLETQEYFRDMHVRRCRAIDESWKADVDTRLLTQDGKPYRGTVLEHLIVLNAAAFFNVGDHNCIRLEDGDWNDGLDMGRRCGEGVGFTSLYGRNLIEMADMLGAVESRLGLHDVELLDDTLMLIDLPGDAVDYDAVAAKQGVLKQYLDACACGISGKTSRISISVLAADLRRKGEWILNHVHRSEWIKNADGFAWFNGYYDGDGKRLEGDYPGGVRMTLTGQVFALMAGAADESQIPEIIRSVNRYLWDDNVGGCRLNTDFGEVLSNLGRFTGFAYGHKENGAMFCHMAAMYAHALYARGRAAEGRRVLDSMYRQCMDFETSRIYPGLPEYFDARGRGMYHYLTGSASWYVYTILTRAFGIRGRLGSLSIRPALMLNQFEDDGEACVQTCFAGRMLRFVFANPTRKEYGAYAISDVKIDGNKAPYADTDAGVMIERAVIERLNVDVVHDVHVLLA